MKNQVCGCSARQTNADSSSIVMPNDQNHGDGFPHNVSVQTGEEFSPEFLRERIESRRIPSMNDVDQIPSKPGFEVIRNHHHQVYDDQTGNIGMRRVDSESCTELTDFSPGKGYGFDIGYETYKDGSNRYYRELQASAQLQTKFSGDLHINSPSCQPVYSLDAGNFYQVYNKAPGMLDSSFSGKVKFLCSVGGKILPRPNDGKLRYVGGETRIISIRKNITYLELVKKASAICKYPFTIKYQLPGEDLDSLISVSSDEDLHHMIEEYHELERSSQRLRLFLVRNGDLEGPNTLEVRATQQNHPEYQYVSAINGMLEPSTKGPSRESSESQGESNYDVCPTVQKGCPTSFHHLETQNGRSNLNFMLSSPCAHVLHSPQVPSNSHALSPSISPVQVKDSNISTADDYDGVASSYRQKINSPYIIATRTYESPPCVDASSVSHSHPNDSVPVILGMNPNSQVLQSYAAPTVNSRFFHPSKDFESHSPSGRGYYDSARGFPAATPLNSENFIPSQDAVGFSPMDDMHAKSHRTISNLFYESQPANEEKPVPSLEQGYHISKDTVEHSQETQNLNKNYKWDKDMANGMKNMPRSDEIVKTYDINNGYTSNTHFLEHEHNLPRIICQPDPKFSSQVPTLKLQVNGTMDAPLMYNPAENAKENGEELPKEYQISPNEPAFFIKSQKGSLDNDQSQLASPVLVPTNEPNSGLDLRCLLVTTEAVLGQRKMMNGSYEGTVKRSHGSVNKDKHDGNSHGESSIKRGTCVDSQPLNNCHETQPTEMPSAVENVEDRQPTDGLSSPNTVPNIQIEHNDRIESPAAEMEAETVISESDCNDSNRIDGDKIDESLTDEAITEMEASIYGLQIIRNADLEDLHELGSGTYGTVYHGKWRGTDVAIKRIKKSCFPGKTSEQEQMTKDFWSEAKILSTLHHPNVVAFYGVVPDGPHIPLATVTEYMANGSLRRVLQRKDRALDQRKKVMIALDAAFGMEYLHLKNVVHFDLKCDNLLVNLGDPHRPVCKVGDFGLSRIKQNTLVSGGVRGTLPWMAPELLNGTSSLVCEKVDVFSFGISMWEILTGEEPYSNMHCGAIIGGIVNDTLRPPIPEHSDPEWKKLMEECWSHDPAARPSFTEITNRLRTMSQALQPKRFNRVKR